MIMARQIRARLEEESVAFAEHEEEEQAPSYRVGLGLYRFVQGLAISAFLAALLLAWRCVADPQEFPIRRIQIHASQQHVEPEVLRDLIAPYVTLGFLRFPSNELEKKLSHLPWVKIASVQRIWPDTILVRITEYEAKARFGADQLIDEDGALFQVPVAMIPAHLPLLTGPASESVSLSHAREMTEQLLAPVGLVLEEIILDERHALHLKLTNGTTMELGRIDPLKHLARFAALYPKIVKLKPDATRAARVDLRYPNGLAIQWR